VLLPPPPLPLPLPFSLLPLDESVLVLDVAWIWGAAAGGRGDVFDLGVERGVIDLEVDFGEGLGLSGEDILSVDESVDGGGKPEIGFEGGDGDGDDDKLDGRRLERGLNFDIVRL
jgi:hypothetical protein